jgi:hypothetical protein
MPLFIEPSILVTGACPCIPVDTGGYQWLLPKIRGYQWIAVDISG